MNKVGAALFALLLVGVAFFGSNEGMQSREARLRDAEIQHQATQDRYAAAKEVTASHGRKAAPEQDKEHHKNRDFFGPEWFLVWVSIPLAGFTAALFFVTFKIARDAEKSAAAALRASTEELTLSRAAHIATNRAWIHPPEVTIGDQPLLFFEATTRPTLGASTSVAIRMTNVGNAPAIHVTTHVRMIAMRTGVYGWSEQIKLADEVRGTALSTGRTLFPKEVYPDNIGYGKVSYAVQIPKEDIDAALVNNVAVGLYVVGCIDYTFPADPATHHQTGFIREICRVTKPYFIRPADGTIPAIELELRDSPMTDARPAD